MTDNTICECTRAETNIMRRTTGSGQTLTRHVQDARRERIALCLQLSVLFCGVTTSCRLDVDVPDSHQLRRLPLDLGKVGDPDDNRDQDENQQRDDDSQYRIRCILRRALAGGIDALGHRRNGRQRRRRWRPQVRAKWRERRRGRRWGRQRRRARRRGSPAAQHWRNRNWRWMRIRMRPPRGTCSAP